MPRMSGISRKTRFRTTAARVTNLLLLLGFCGLAGTGLLLVFRLPPGSRGGRGLDVLGWDRHAWGDLHFYVACGVVALLVVHLLLHLTWLKKVAGHGRWRLVLLGVGLGIALVVAPLLLPVSGRHSTSLEPRVTTLTETRPVSNEPPVSYTRDVQPIFEMSCVDCHGPKKAKADFRIDDPQTLLKQEDSGCLVLPGRPAQSRLIKIVSGRIRFKKATEDHFLPDDEVQLLTRWIREGARIDN